jgi:hypothetical protein
MRQTYLSLFGLVFGLVLLARPAMAEARGDDAKINDHAAIKATHTPKGGEGERQRLPASARDGTSLARREASEAEPAEGASEADPGQAAKAEPRKLKVASAAASSCRS